MKITVLGAGGAFSPLSRGNSAFLVETHGRRILIDAGSSVQYILRDEMGIALQSITDVIVTHCHADHIGSLETILYACKYMPDSKGKPNIWADKRVMHELICALRPGLGWNQNGEAYAVDEEFFIDCSGLTNTARATLGEELQFFEVPHVGNMPSFGLLLGRLFVSGDTKDVAIGPCWRESGDDLPKLIFHDAQRPGASDAHCPVTALEETLDEEMKQRTWIYHCPAGFDKPAGFAGVLDKGMVFEL